MYPLTIKLHVFHNGFTIVLAKCKDAGAASHRFGMAVQQKSVLLLDAVAHCPMSNPLQLAVTIELARQRQLIPAHT